MQTETLKVSLDFQSLHSDMVWIQGGTFRMGSNEHYPEEAPVSSRLIR